MWSGLEYQRCCGTDINDVVNLDTSHATNQEDPLKNQGVFFAPVGLHHLLIDAGVSAMPCWFAGELFWWSARMSRRQVIAM